MKSNFTRSAFTKWLVPLKAGALALALAVTTGQGVNAQSTTPPSGYCGTSHGNMGNNGCANGWGFHLLGVGLNGWQHTFTCTNTVYRYWNNLGSVTTLSQGATYTFTAQTASTGYTTSAGGWIDWNQDGTFSSNEYIGANTTGASAPWFTSQFTVPCNATPGTTILRVRCDYASAVGPNYGCNNTLNNYGETVDYIVTIGSSSSPSANFSMPDSIYINSPATFINANQVGYISHQWDLLNVGANPDATSINYTRTFNTAGSYQMRLTSTNCQGSAVTTKNFNVVTPTSSPIANFVASQNKVFYDGSTPIYIDFFDLSTFGPTSWEWILSPDWLNGAPYIWMGSQYDQNTSVFFHDVETYDLCLVVTNSAGADTLCRSNYIEITTPSASGSGPFENWMCRETESTLDSGTIYDPGGPTGIYQNNQYCTFTIKPCGAQSVTLSFFGTFDLEACCDDVFIYDGPDVSYPQIGNYFGTNLPSSVTANSGVMTILFVSDVSVTPSGFNATWTADVVQFGPPVADFVVPDSVFECSMGNDIKFVNTSTNITPQTEFDWIMTYDPNVSYPSSYADIYNEFEPSWPYFSTGTYNVRMVAKSCAGVDTAYKSFVLASPTGNPEVDFVASDRILKVGGSASLTSMTKAGCEYEWDIFPTTYTIENGGSVNDPNIDLKFSAPGSYTVRLTVDNDLGSSFEEKTNYIDVIDYCKPTVQYSTVSDVGISRVMLNDIDNESAAGMSPGYQNYTDDFATTLTLGEVYNYTIERPSSVNAVNRKIWIDYNRDGDFADANELVASESGSSNLNFTGTFLVPALQDVVLGETRMRVGIGLANTSLVPCGPNQVGEYEDYTVILVTDDIPPVITMIAGDSVVEKNGNFTDPGATATDNLEGNITSRIVADNGVNMAQTGVYFIVYTVSDLSGNPAPQVVRKVTVVEDLTAPSIVLTGANPLVWSVLVPYVDPTVTATDMPSGANISHLITKVNPVDVNAIGDYIIEYTVIDNYGNEATATRLVQVRDITAPVIVATATMPVQVGTPFVDPVTATDNFDQTVKPVVVNGTVNSMVVGSYDVEYSVVDASGNVGTNMIVTFEVADYIAPVVHYTPGTETVIVDVFDYNWASKPGMGVSASDNYYNHADLVLSSGSFDIDMLGTYVLTYTATDEAGNVSVFERTVMVVDREKPTVLSNPLNLERWSSYDLMTGVVVVDNYYAPVDFATPQNNCSVEIIRSNVDFNYPGIYQVTYLARDGSGNVSFETTRMVLISDAKANGLQEGGLANAVKVYPNPNAGQFSLEISAVLEANATIQITNSLGSVVKQLNAGDLVNGKADIDLGMVSPGVYFVQIISGGNTATHKVVVQ